MDSGSNDITFNTEIYYQFQPHIRSDGIKLIFVKLFSVSQNAHCDTEVENAVLTQVYTKLYRTTINNDFRKNLSPKSSCTTRKREKKPC
jgi:hypothetical protein